MRNDFAKYFKFNQEVVTVAGRICCDNEGRANAHTILLEGSRETSAGKCIPLDLSEIKDYSLFPGQVRFYLFFFL